MPRRQPSRAEVEWLQLVERSAVIEGHQLCQRLAGPKNQEFFAVGGCVHQFFDLFSCLVVGDSAHAHSVLNLHESSHMREREPVH